MYFYVDFNEVFFQTKIVFNKNPVENTAQYISILF